jgi:hypothetical protein
MRRSIAFIVGALISSLFTACPTHEVNTSKMVRIQVQGHVYDNLTKQPVADSYVGLFFESSGGGSYPYSTFVREELAKTVTDNNGFYSLQCSLESRPCEQGTIRLFLNPPDSAGGPCPCTTIQCTENLQTIDLYK